jgi:hypothetical protein
MEVDHTGVPLKPKKVAAKYKTIVGALLRKHIPISYRKWIAKQNDLWRVPESLKDAIWEEWVLKFFTFLGDCDMEQIKKKIKETMGTCFKNFKLTLYQKFILEDKEPNWDGDEYASQKNIREAFKQYRPSEEYLAVSKKNKVNSLKATDPHRLGSQGYTSKIDEFQAELDELEQHGVMPQTAYWSLDHCLM